MDAPQAQLQSAALDGAQGSRDGLPFGLVSWSAVSFAPIEIGHDWTWNDRDIIGEPDKAVH